MKLLTTIFDVLLPQIFAGDKTTKQDIVALGDGRRGIGVHPAEEIAVSVVAQLIQERAKRNEM